jgi:hypothetical protein
MFHSIVIQKLRPYSSYSGSEALKQRCAKYKLELKTFYTAFSLTKILTCADERGGSSTLPSIIKITALIKDNKKKLSFSPSNGIKISSLFLKKKKEKTNAEKEEKRIFLQNNHSRFMLVHLRPISKAKEPPFIPGGGKNNDKYLGIKNGKY